MKPQDVVLRKCIEDHEKFTHVIGIDEVGWGSCAGPLVVSATVLPFEFENPVIKKTKVGVQFGFKDSKRYTTDKSRKAGAEYAKKNVLAHETMFSLPQDVATYGPTKSLSYLQRKLARHMLKLYPSALVVVDGKHPISGIKRSQQVALIGADAKIPAVSAASIIAKVARDGYMCELGEAFFPRWDFHKNKGYPTPEHLEKLRAWGPTRVHRLNVSVVKEVYDKKGWYEDGKAAEQH